MNDKIVIALGHKAFGNTFPKQKENVKAAAASIADVIEAGYKVVLTHSNGTQVGMIHSAMREHSLLEPSNTVAPISICTAMSQGYIGFDLQNEIRAALLERGIYRSVVSLVTQVRVDPFDPAFGNPSKLIGKVMDYTEAEKEKEKGNYVEPVEGGYRRIIAAPTPMEIYEKDAINTLVNDNQVVIAAGGGGIPVLQQGTRLKGASGVIEKDLAAECLAECIGADTLLLLTGVDKVCLNFETDDEIKLDSMSVSEAQGYIDEGHFRSKSMLPKVQAAVKFVSNPGEKRAIISSIGSALSALNNKTGTIIQA
ncbi:MAG: carbamate kinase [Lachnospiraceae bacterium]|nr:carbamate kinase [Lachnospiraceae bacterium]